MDFEHIPSSYLTPHHLLLSPHSPVPQSSVFSLLHLPKPLWLCVFVSPGPTLHFHLNDVALYLFKVWFERNPHLNNNYLSWRWHTTHLLTIDAARGTLASQLSCSRSCLGIRYWHWTTRDRARTPARSGTMDQTLGSLPLCSESWGGPIRPHRYLNLARILTKRIWLCYAVPAMLLSHVTSSSVGHNSDVGLIDPIGEAMLILSFGCNGIKFFALILPRGKMWRN